MHPRRALLFIPGDSEQNIQKATSLDVDGVILDLEDGVAWNQKEGARATVEQTLLDLDFGRSERVVRINAIGSGMEEADLQKTIAARPDAYTLPKVETPAQLIWLDDKLSRYEAKYEWQHGSIRVIAIVETALGIMNLREIAQAGTRLDALMFGAKDLIGDIGGIRTRAGQEVFYARSKVVTTAAAFNLQAIDMVFVDLNDVEGLEVECRQAVELGYQGKMAIHPNQIPIIQKIFTPTADQIADARRLIEAYNDYQSRGSGVFTLDGKMVDAPMLKAAEHVLAKAQQVE